MAFVRPFKAVRYNPAKIKHLSRVVAPPYDIIPKDMQEKLYRSHPRNIVRIILGRIKKTDGPRDNRYTRAKKFFEVWLKNDIMIRDNSPAVYIYSQIYKDGKRMIDRTGFIGLMGLDLNKKTRVLPHENTLTAPKADRLNLMRSVAASLSPIFVLYDDEGHKIKNRLKNFCRKNKAIMDVNFNKTRHRVWRMDDLDSVKKIEDIMAPKEVFIADGHHRYETARSYCLEIQGEDVPREVKRAAGFMMVYFVEADAKMLTILPAHRLVKDIGRIEKSMIIKRLEEFFYIEKTKGLAKMMSRLSGLAGGHAFGMYLGRGAFYVLRLKDLKESDRAIKDKSKDWKRLDVAILHLFVLQHILGVRDEDDNIEFVKSPNEAATLVDRNRFKIAFFLNPTKVSQVRRIAKLGEKMPRKATYFYPKPLSGLVINKFGS